VLEVAFSDCGAVSSERRHADEVALELRSVVKAISKIWKTTADARLAFTDLATARRLHAEHRST